MNTSQHALLHYNRGQQGQPYGTPHTSTPPHTWWRRSARLCGCGRCGCRKGQRGTHENREACVGNVGD